MDKARKKLLKKARKQIKRQQEIRDSVLKSQYGLPRRKPMKYKALNGKYYSDEFGDEFGSEFMGDMGFDPW